MSRHVELLHYAPPQHTLDKLRSEKKCKGVAFVSLLRKQYNNLEMTSGY